MLCVESMSEMQTE